MKTHGSKNGWILALALVGCAGEGDGGEDGGSQCAGGKCDEVAPENFACKELVDQSGRGVDNVLTQLTDPLAEFALKRGGEGCPESFEDVMERLRANDNNGCSNGGMESRFISESGPFESVANPLVRSVTTRTCNSRQAHELIFSIFGVTKSRIPEGAEIIAFDREAGEFNYYEAGNGEIVFFGSSTDLIKGTGGRCKGCHTAGGLMMKELRNPWLHWEQLDRVTGPIIDAHKDDLGTSKFSRGSNMESLTKSGNSKWNETKVLLMTNPDSGFTPADMLKPLFCGTQVNLDTAATSANSEPREIPQAFLAHCKLFGSGTSCSGTHFGESGGVSLASGVYNAAVMAAGQTLPGGSGKTDTLFAMPFIEPSLEDIDYIEKLEDAGVIDDDFVADVLAIDFTRPIDSEARCELLEFAPEWADLEGPASAGSGGADDGGSGGMDGGSGGSDGGSGSGGMGAVDFDGAELQDPTVIREATAATVRAAFIANLQAANPSAESTAGQFLAALQTADDASSHRSRVSDFVKACNDRDDAAFMADALEVVHAQRSKLGADAPFEFEDTMPKLSTQPRAGAHLDPMTCELVTD